MIPAILWIARIGTYAWAGWWAFWKIKEETYEGAILNVIDQAYGNTKWYTDRGLSESQVFQVITKVRYYVSNKLFKFPNDLEQARPLQAQIGKDLGIGPNDQGWNGIGMVLIALMKRIKPTTETPTTSPGTLYDYIRGGVTNADTAANLPVDVLKKANETVNKIEDNLPWFLKSRNVAKIAVVGIGVYLFGPAIRKQLGQ